MTKLLPEIVIKVPATTANLGPGFDSFGLALSLYNQFSFKAANIASITIADNCTVDMSKLDLTPNNNLIYKAFQYYFEQQQQPPPIVQITVESHIPLARGLGSSSTAIAAGLFAANQWHNNACSIETLITYATELEGHPDNVAPALTGGCCLCDDDQIYPLTWPTEWGVIIVVPQYPLLTEEARSVMPEKVTMVDAVFNLRKSSVLTYAIQSGNANAFKQALKDKLHQPYRKPLIVEFDSVEKLALANGAFGCVISGAGPSMAIFTPKQQQATLAKRLEEQAKNLSNTEVPFKVLTLAIDTQGSHVVTG